MMCISGSMLREIISPSRSRPRRVGSLAGLLLSALSSSPEVPPSSRPVSEPARLNAVEETDAEPLVEGDALQAPRNSARYASLAHPIRPMCCPHAAHFIIGNSIPSCTTMNVLFLHAAHAENEICSCCVLSFLKARKTTLSFMSWPLLGITFWSSGAVEAALRRPAYRNVSLLGAIS